MYICLYKQRLCRRLKIKLNIGHLKKKNWYNLFFNYLVFVLTVLAPHCNAWTSLVVVCRLSCPTAMWDISSLTKN